MVGRGGFGLDELKEMVIKGSEIGVNAVVCGVGKG